MTTTDTRCKTCGLMRSDAIHEWVGMDGYHPFVPVPSITAALCDCYTSDEGTIQCKMPNGIGCPYEALKQTTPLMTPIVLESLTSKPSTTDAVETARNTVLAWVTSKGPGDWGPVHFEECVTLLQREVEAAIVARERERCAICQATPCTCPNGSTSWQDHAMSLEANEGDLQARIAELESNLVIAHNNCDVLTETVDRRVETIRQQQARIEALEAVVTAARDRVWDEEDGDLGAALAALDKEEGP